MRGMNSGNINSARMATVTAVTFTVAVALVLRGTAHIKADPINADCSGAKEGKQEFNVIKPNTTLKLKCDDADTSEVTPAFSKEDFKVCTDADCDPQPLLSEYITGATGQEDTPVTATVVINDLPSTEKIFYVKCGNTKPCYIVVKVAPSKPGGVTPGSPLLCANGGGAITIKIPEKGSTAQFTCGKFTLYPRAEDRVFGEDCKKEESLKDLVRSVNNDVYTLTAGNKPPKKKWCYLCASSAATSSPPGKPSDYCVVHVESSSRTQSSSAVALAVILPCVLAMLRIT